jgi:drug/metabolite transporter (DMT)-like permease
MLGAALCWGLFTTLSRPLTRRTHPLLLTVLEMTVALPLIALVALPSLPQAEWAAVDGGIVGALIFTGTLSSGLTFVIWNRAVRHVGPTSTIAFANAVPLAAAAFGYLLLGTPVTAVQVAGGACIVGGIVLLRRVRRAEAQRVPV